MKTIGRRHSIERDLIRVCIEKLQAGELALAEIESERAADCKGWTSERMRMFVRAAERTLADLRIFPVRHQKRFFFLGKANIHVVRARQDAPRVICPIGLIRPGASPGDGTGMAGALKT